MGYMDKIKAHKGFTLIELLVVISIIAMLSSVILVSVQNVRVRSRDTVRSVDFEQFEKALELYYGTYGRYPCGDANTNGWTNPYGTVDSSGSDGFLNHTHGLVLVNCIAESNDPPNGVYPDFYPKYWPKDPRNVVPEYGYGLLYWYSVTADRQSYLLVATMEENPELMTNDGGCMATAYEIWGGKRPNTLENLCD
jgi:prepilin-type N-terminal cleavage/methylation domain-containing protein